MSENIRDYRLGGFFTIPATTVALIIAYFVGAPMAAMLSIGICGYGVSLLLLLLGKKVY